MNRDELGVEPICTVLQVAPSSYCAAKRREVSPSVRTGRYAVMMQALMVLGLRTARSTAPTNSARGRSVPGMTSAAIRLPGS